MDEHTRRAFLGRMGAGALAGAIGVGLARDLGLFGSLAEAAEERLTFGALEPLVDLLQETPADALLPRLAERLDAGVPLGRIVAAGALANTRAFGGHDYTGYHCFMALVPALEMASHLPPARAPLPVLKVLHRNSRRIHEKGRAREDALGPVAATPPGDGGGDLGAYLVAASREGAREAAEARLAAAAREHPEQAFRSLQPLTRDNIDVHQVVLTFRAWDMLRLTDGDHADALLRQTMHQCFDREHARDRRGRPAPAIRTLLPEFVADHGLDREPSERRRLEDDELAVLARLVFTSERDAAAHEVARLLGEGVAREDVGEALTLAGAWLLLHDPGKKRAQPGKPVGSVHGASVGIHAADSAQAWRGIAAATPPAVANASLVTGAWHTAGQSGGMDRDAPHHATAREEAAATAPEALLEATDEAVRSGEQARAAALAERYGAEGGEPRALIDRLLVPALEDDGALHHEKYFHTATEAFATSRPPHHWPHLVALTRVMASGRGHAAPGVEQAQSLLRSG